MSKKIMRLWVLGLFSGVIALGTGSARADTMTFNFGGDDASLGGGPAGPLSSPLVFEDSDEALILEVTGYYFDGSQWQSTDLFRRKNPTDDVGLGVCSPADLVDNGHCPPNTGDYNELDNAGQAELIQLAKGSDWDWSSVSLSSLDTNGSGPMESGILWGSDSGDPLNRRQFEIWRFAGGGPVNPSFDIPEMYQSIPFLYFEPIDISTIPLPTVFTPLWFDHNNHEENFNNDFLLNTVVLNQPERAAEPASLFLLLAGLGALGLTRRRD